MYHGGTTFGFMNGANADESGWYAPQVTSYDYGKLANNQTFVLPFFIPKSLFILRRY